MQSGAAPAHGPGRDKVLIVEDSRTFASLLTRAVSRELDLECVVCRTFQQASDHLGALPCSGRNEYFAALLDLNLPDAQDGEVVNLVTGANIPSIVFTGELSDDLRDIMWSKRIVDYVLKQDPDSIAQVVSVVGRLRSNIGKKVLLADDSSTTRQLIRSLLEAWNFTVLEARDGLHALELLNTEKDVALLITDYHMPHMNGIELVREARRTLSKSRLPVIGLSGAGGATTSAYFIKAGANDYMHKPFLTEELYCRVIHNIENSEYIATIRRLAERDFLTDIYNRRSFFAYGNKLFEHCRRNQRSFAVAMLDIDHFKRCNDTYGHDAGDEVIRMVARMLVEAMDEDDVVARLGGEEFGLACCDRTAPELEALFQGIRIAAEQARIKYGGNAIAVTVSAGVSATAEASLEGMLRTADSLLYQAKESGRNQVRFAFEARPEPL